MKEIRRIVDKLQIDGQSFIFCPSCGNSTNQEKSCSFCREKKFSKTETVIINIFEIIRPKILLIEAEITDYLKQNGVAN